MYKDPFLHALLLSQKIAVQNIFRKQFLRLLNKLFSYQMRNFDDKSHFYSSFKQFWVSENREPVLEKLRKFNGKANAKAISTFDFSTAYTKLPHFDLIS